MIDWATLVLLLVAFAMKVMNFSSNIKPGLEESTNSAAYTDLQLYAERMYTVRKIYSFNSVGLLALLPKTGLWSLGNFSLQ